MTRVTLDAGISCVACVRISCVAYAQMKEADMEAEKTAKQVDKEDPDYKPPADA